MKQNKMIQNALSVPSDTLATIKHPQSHREIHSQQSQTTLQSKGKADIFILRFKNNQHTLKSKFQKMFSNQNGFSPSMNIKLNDSFLVEDGEKFNRRAIQREKWDLKEELSQSLNQTKYYQRKNEEFQKTCSFLERKVKKIEEVRRSRRSEVTKLQHDLQSISQSVKHEKSRYYQNVKQSKETNKKNRILCELKKCSQADTVRHQRYLHQEKIHDERQATKELNQSRCKFVADCEKNASLSVSRCIEKKQKGAEEFKLERLFRQLKEKQQIKIECARAKQENIQVAEYKQKTMDLQEKIKNYRETLGERVFVPIKQSRVKLQYHRSHTQENEGSVKSGFLSGKKRKYGDESFEDQ